MKAARAMTEKRLEYVHGTVNMANSMNKAHLSSPIGCDALLRPNETQWLTEAKTTDSQGNVLYQIDYTAFYELTRRFWPNC